MTPEPVRPRSPDGRRQDELGEELAQLIRVDVVADAASVPSRRTCSYSSRGLSDLLEPPVVDDGDLVGDLPRLVLVVGHEDSRHVQLPVEQAASRRKITLERIVRLFQGPLAPISCATRHNPEPCPTMIGCTLRDVWAEVRDATIEPWTEPSLLSPASAEPAAR